MPRIIPLGAVDGATLTRWRASGSPPGPAEPGAVGTPEPPAHDRSHPLHGRSRGVERLWPPPRLHRVAVPPPPPRLAAETSLDALSMVWFETDNSAP